MTKKIKNFLFLVLLAVPLFSPARAASPAPRPLLGATVYAGAWGFTDAPAKLAAMKAEGFALVSFVPSYPYVDLNRIDFTHAPAWPDLERAVNAALDVGLTVVIKPHLDPPSPSDAPESHTWRKGAPWRGYFDVDPMCKDYREGVIGRSLKLLSRALAARPSAAPVRLELGAELMNSVAYGATRWEELLAWAKTERRRLGLNGRVLLSHNFEHHFEIPGDVVLRMSPEGRRALARYIKGLDAIALSQYMDLTAALPAAERDSRLPTAQEVAQALTRHERRFREDILVKALGLRPSEIAPLHIGEFGVGVGGLKFPNEWSGALTPAQELALALEIARGHEGLTRYLALSEGRTVRSAVLWTVGRHYDVFGWSQPEAAIPAAAAADRAYLAGKDRP